MAEYIDKDKLLNDIECIDISDCTDIDDIFIEVERTIDEQPTADVAEVRHGEWIKKPHVSKEYKQCNICKYDFSRLIPDNFCPNCGAKMDGKVGVDDGWI